MAIGLPRPVSMCSNAKVKSGGEHRVLSESFCMRIALPKHEHPWTAKGGMGLGDRELDKCTYVPAFALPFSTAR
jgi:hypothetical protein